MECRRILNCHLQGLIGEDRYWRWPEPPERSRANNAIDLFVQVLGISFHGAMRKTTVT